MLSHVTHGGASHSPAADLHQADPVISAVYYGEIGSLGGDLFHTLAALFHLSNRDKCLSRFYPPFIEMCTAVALIWQGLSRIKNRKLARYYNNIDKWFISFISTNRPLSGAWSFCYSLGRK